MTSPTKTQAVEFADLESAKLGCAELESAELERVLDAFELALRTSSSVNWQSCLPRHDHPQFGRAAAEIARIDLETQWELGNRVLAQTYRDALPQVFDNPQLFAEILYEEFRQRHLSGDVVDRTEYADRYGINTDSWPTKDAIRAHDEVTSRRVSRSDSTFRSLEFALDSLDNRANIPVAGDHFDGFELVEVLGEGAFARVFLAKQTELANRAVALKIASDRSFEADRLAKLQHTNIVPVYSTHSADGLHAVCMPYLGQLTLADVLMDLKSQHVNQKSSRKSGQVLFDALIVNRDLPQAARISAAFGHLRHRTYTDAVVWILSRVAEGLRYAHRASIVHGDLKPANILMADDGEPRLLDFNLSSDISAEQPALVLAGGTLPYMSPNQLQSTLDGGPITTTDDVFSLGVIAFELLTLKRPFPNRAGNYDELVAAMIADRQARSSNERSDLAAIGFQSLKLPPSVVAIVDRCLRPTPGLKTKPGSHYADASALSEDLCCHLENRRLQHAPDRSLRERIRKWSRRHPRLTSAGGVAALALILLIAATMAFLMRGKQIARLDAQNTLHEFRTQNVLARAALSNPFADVSLDTDAFDQVQETIKLYVPLAKDNLQQSAGFQLLNTEQQREVRGGLAEILSLMAARSKGTDSQTSLSSLRQWLGSGSQLGWDSPNQFVTAMSALRRGDYDKSYELLSSQRDRSSIDPAVWLALGNACVGKGDLSEAEACYATFIGLLPDSHLGYFYRGRSRLDRHESDDLDSDVHRRRDDDLSAALADFDRVLELRPNLAAAWLNRAIVLRKLDRHAEAVKAFTHAIDTGNASTRAYFLRSDSYRRIGNVQQSQADYQLATTLVPNDESGWTARGTARVSQDPEGALADFDEAIRINPHSRKAWQNSVYVLIEVLDRKQDALDCLGRMLAVKSHDPIALAARGVLLARMGNRDAALRDIELLLSRTPSAKSVYQAATAFALTATNDASDVERAVALLAQAFQRDPTLIEIASQDPDLDTIRAKEHFMAVIQAATTLHNSSKLESAPR